MPNVGVVLLDGAVAAEEASRSHVSHRHFIPSGWVAVEVGYSLLCCQVCGEIGEHAVWVVVDKVVEHRLEDGRVAIAKESRGDLVQRLLKNGVALIASVRVISTS